MFPLLLALLAVAPEKTVDQAVIQSMMDSTAPEATAWGHCVVDAAIKEQQRFLSIRGTGDPVGVGFAACTAEERAFRDKLKPQLKSAGIEDWEDQLVDGMRDGIKNGLVMTLVKSRIDFETPRDCMILKRSGGIPTEMVADCEKYGIR